MVVWLFLGTLHVMRNLKSSFSSIEHIPKSMEGKTVIQSPQPEKKLNKTREEKDETSRAKSLSRRKVTCQVSTEQSIPGLLSPN